MSLLPKHAIMSVTYSFVQQAFHGFVVFLYSNLQTKFMQIIGSNIVYLSETGSTNEYLFQLLRETRPGNGSVFITDNQTRGRGTDTNTWESEPGKNLTFSIILYPKFLPVERQFLLNQAIALGISEFVKENVAHERVTIKWPNDIYIEDKKVCGTLIQSSIMGQSFDFVVVGIGLNVNQSVFRSSAPNPVSLLNITRIENDLGILLTQLCKKLDHWYQLVLDGEQTLVKTNYLSTMYRLNEWHRYMIKGANYESRITGISEYGQLILEGRQGKEWVCDVKEVTYL
jgi:BirA family transcriptional regulator, biotin operon repressor / biotin---[acetyl-CoA-carboxylase] ligase